jgi:lipid II isoglutaminyl synthase (glutamine-hydrolysing)
MKPIHLVHLYPEKMNIYGDTGNRIVLVNRLKWRDLPVKVSLVETGEELPADADLILGGGGQDAGQEKVEKDLLSKAAQLKAMAEDGVVMLMICGMYQLLGEAFITKDKVTIKGAGILPIITKAGEDRLIGNIVINSDYGQLVGYENHSGLTDLKEGAKPLGKVISGAGNNGRDKTEGIRFYNIFGSYMHGPILSKNPQLADALLSLAAERKGYKLEALDDSLELKAAELAAKRPR